MLSSSDRDRVSHNLDAIAKIEQVLGHISYAEFADDWQRRLFVERLIEVIGEAANHVSAEYVAAHPYMPWAKMVGMRNMISHEYFRLDPTVLWETATNSIPHLKSQIAALISQG